MSDARRCILLARSCECWERSPSQLSVSLAEIFMAISVSKLPLLKKISKIILILMPLLARRWLLCSAGSMTMSLPVHQLPQPGEELFQMCQTQDLESPSRHRSRSLHRHHLGSQPNLNILHQLFLFNQLMVIHLNLS